MAYILALAYVTLYEVCYVFCVAVCISGIGKECPTGGLTFYSVSTNEFWVDLAILLVTWVGCDFHISVLIIR